MACMYPQSERGRDNPTEKCPYCGALNAGCYYD